MSECDTSLIQWIEPAGAETRPSAPDRASGVPGRVMRRRSRWRRLRWAANVFAFSTTLDLIAYWDLPLAGAGLTGEQYFLLSFLGGLGLAGVVFMGATLGSLIGQRWDPALRRERCPRRTRPGESGRVPQLP